MSTKPPTTADTFWPHLFPHRTADPGVPHGSRAMITAPRVVRCGCGLREGHPGACERVGGEK